MPEPTNEYSVDKLITYKFVDLIANKDMVPNVITILNIIPSMISLYYLHCKQYELFYIFLIIRIILDCLDGHVARKYNKMTKFGEKLDRYTDIFYYSVVLIMIFANHGIIFQILCVLALITLYESQIQIIKSFFDFMGDNTLISIPLLCVLLIHISK